MDNSRELLCQPSTGWENDWVSLYEASFPEEEKMPVEQIRRLISEKNMVLHRTLDEANHLLCFSLVTLLSDFCLLAYIATNPEFRSGGIGSRHLRRLIRVLRLQHPQHLGLFLEIESTREAGLDADTRNIRLRRLAFYERLQSKRMESDYWFPSLTAPNTIPPKPAELLWFEWCPGAIDDAALRHVISEIYEKGYGLPADHPIIREVLGQLRSRA